jgi:hypothetical protein
MPVEHVIALAVAIKFPAVFFEQLDQVPVFHPAELPR